jgi:hypothetical protein
VVRPSPTVRMRGVVDASFVLEKGSAFLTNGTYIYVCCGRLFIKDFLNLSGIGEFFEVSNSLSEGVLVVFVSLSLVSYLNCFLNSSFCV